MDIFSEPASDRQAHILDAATDVFMRYGFRKASMQDIAEAAGMSRAALYLHFRNKEDVFRSGLGRLYTYALAEAEAALKAEGAFGDRLHKAVTGYALLLLVPTQSPHGPELFAVHDSLAGDLAGAAADAFRVMFATAIGEAEAGGEIATARLGQSPAGLAQTLYYAVDGIKTAPGDAATVTTRLGTLARAFALALQA